MGASRNERRLEHKRIRKSIANAARDMSCKGCIECCTALAVPELNKKALERCVYMTETGCSIYATRPNSCRAYMCMWRYGLLTKKDKPNISGIIVEARTPAAKIGAESVLVARELREGAGEKFEPVMLDWAERGIASILVTSDGKRSFFGPPDVCEKVETLVEAHQLK